MSFVSIASEKGLKFDGSMYAVYNFDDAGQLSNLVNSSDSTTDRLKSVSVSDIADLSLAGFGRLLLLGWRRRLVGRIWR